MLNMTEVHEEGLWEVFVAEDIMVIRKQMTRHVQGWRPGGQVQEPDWNISSHSLFLKEFITSLNY